MESVNAATSEMPVIKTLDEREPSSQPGTPAPPVWTEGSPQGFSHRFSRTRKVTARRNVNPAPSYILDMMRTDPHVEYNTIDLTCDDETSLKLQAGQLTSDYTTLSTNGLQVGESYRNLNHVDGFRKLASTPGIESYEGLGITIDRTEYVPREITPSVMHHNHLMRAGEMALKTGSNWADTPLDPTSLSQNQMLAMMLQTSEPIPRPWGRSSVEPNKTFNYPGVDLSKYGPLPQLESIPPAFSEKLYQETKPLAYPYSVPPSDLIPAKDIKREVTPSMDTSDMLSLESMQMRWSERMSSSASSECSTSIGSRNEEVANKNMSHHEQPNKRRRTGLQAPLVEPHLWTRKGLRPCAARLARSAEETMQLNSPSGDKDDPNSAWKMDVTPSQEPPSPQYSDISDAPSIPLSAQTSRHSRSSSISPHGSVATLAEGAVENFTSPKKSPSKVSVTSPLASAAAIGIKRCAVRVPRCSSRLSVSLASSSGSSTSETPKQHEVDPPKTTTPSPDVENLDDEAPFKCSLCMLRFWKDDLFRDHACLGRPWHQCPMCLSRFLSIANLQRHMANKHSAKYGKIGKTKKHAELSENVSDKEKVKNIKLPIAKMRSQAPEGMSESDIHKWLFSVWDYNKDKSVPPDGIKCLFCVKVCFQVLSMKAHLLGVHKINLFNRQFQTPRNSQVTLNIYKKSNLLKDSNDCVLSPDDAETKRAAKAKSGAELKQKIASLLMHEIEKSKKKVAKPPVQFVENESKIDSYKPLTAVNNVHDSSKDTIVSSKYVDQLPNGVVRKTVGLLTKGKQKQRLHYVQALCQTMMEKNVSVVQLRNWLLEINTGTFDRYECILCMKIFNTLKSMQCHCLSVHRIPPQIKSFKPIWRGMRALRVKMHPQTEDSENKVVGQNDSVLDHLDVETSVTIDMKRDLTNCLSKNLRNLLVKSHLVESDDFKGDVEADVRDVIQYAVHSVSEEAMVASMKQFHPPVIKGIVRTVEEIPVAAKLDKEPPSAEDIDKWLASLKTAASDGQGMDNQLECLICSEMCGDVESMATHVSLVHRLTALPLPSLPPESNKGITEDVNTQVSEAADSPSPPPLPFKDLSDLRMYTKVLLMRLYTDETLSAFGFPECSTDQLLMRILEHSGFSYCWFEDEAEEWQHNALCRNLKTLLAVSLPPEIKAHINLNANPMPVVLEDLLNYTAEEQTSASDE